MKNNIDPFLKWAGGKRWLVKSYAHLIPTQFNRYIEPFLGSAALFFHLDPKKAILSDVNSDLIETYKSVQSNPIEIEKKLKLHHKNHSKEYYYKVRSSSPRNSISRAAKFIYLNRTCWNGLYRVNLKGEFNVPIGTKTNVSLESDNFTLASQKLKKSKIVCCDFEGTISLARAGDFLFVDPPYTVKHNLNGFVKYNENIFKWSDQLRLRDALIEAKNRGVLIALTNANHPSLLKLYKDDFYIDTLTRKSVIAANSKNRGNFSELFITAGIN